jgi:hypothetical protein
MTCGGKVKVPFLMLSANVGVSLPIQFPWIVAAVIAMVCPAAMTLVGDSTMSEPAAVPTVNPLMIVVPVESSILAAVAAPLAAAAGSIKESPERVRTLPETVPQGRDSASVDRTVPLALSKRKDPAAPPPSIALTTCWSRALRVGML